MLIIVFNKAVFVLKVRDDLLDIFFWRFFLPEDWWFWCLWEQVKFLKFFTISCNYVAVGISVHHTHSCNFIKIFVFYHIVLITWQSDLAQSMTIINWWEDMESCITSVHTDASQITLAFELGENLHVFFVDHLKTSQMGIVYQASCLISQKATIKSELSTIKWTDHFHFVKLSIHFIDYNQWAIV